MDTEALSQLNIGCTRRTERAQFAYLLAGKTAATCGTALLRGILHVVGARSEEPVSRVTASGIIAFVADVQAAWNWAVKYLEQYAARKPGTPVFVYQPVTLTVQRALPFPTIGGVVASLDAPPQTHLKWSARPEPAIKEIIERKLYTFHVNASMLGVGRSPAVRAARGFSVPIISRRGYV
jgi:hypothetical protein